MRAFTKRDLDIWQQFYVLYPFDDRHRFHRPAALISASMGTGDLVAAYGKRVKFLQPDPPAPEVLSGRFSEADMRTIRTMRSLGVPDMVT